MDEKNTRQSLLADLNAAVAIAGLVALAGLAYAIFLFVKAVEAGNLVAVSVLAVLWSIAMFAAGAMFYRSAADHVYRHERDRETQQQVAFNLNAKENMGLLLGMAQVQAAQARAGATQNRDAWQVVREQHKLLTAGANGSDDDGDDVTTFDYGDLELSDL